MMKKIALFLVFFIVAFALVSFVSCKNEVKQPDPVKPPTDGEPLHTLPDQYTPINRVTYDQIDIIYDMIDTLVQDVKDLIIEKELPCNPEIDFEDVVIEAEGSVVIESEVGVIDIELLGYKEMYIGFGVVIQSAGEEDDSIKLGVAVNPILGQVIAAVLDEDGDPLVWYKIDYKNEKVYASDDGEAWRDPTDEEMGDLAVLVAAILVIAYDDPTVTLDGIEIKFDIPQLPVSLLLTIDGKASIKGIPGSEEDEEEEAKEAEAEPIEIDVEKLEIGFAIIPTATLNKIEAALEDEDGSIASIGDAGDVAFLIGDVKVNGLGALIYAGESMSLYCKSIDIEAVPFIGETVSGIEFEINDLVAFNDQTEEDHDFIMADFAFSFGMKQGDNSIGFHTELKFDTDDIDEGIIDGLTLVNMASAINGDFYEPTDFIRAFIDGIVKEVILMGIEVDPDSGIYDLVDFFDPDGEVAEE